MVHTETTMIKKVLEQSCGCLNSIHGKGYKNCYMASNDYTGIYTVYNNKHIEVATFKAVDVASIERPKNRLDITITLAS